MKTTQLAVRYWARPTCASSSDTDEDRSEPTSSSSRCVILRNLAACGGVTEDLQMNLHNKLPSTFPKKFR